ncbi:hypothetical protein [Rhizobium sp. NFR03]|uniref:hypothetical protein n=1 Tax=Rhizobium sp. NFR03 TaxID=1566263 RepID=UPI00111496F6|nr:hypothetical protein [Rhizobium sp. NFR03]
MAGVVEQRYGAILLRKQQWKGKKCTHLCALQAKPLMLNQDFLQGGDLTKIERILGVWPTTGGCQLFDGTVVEREAVCLACPRPAGAIMSSKIKLCEVPAGDHDNP